MTRVPDHISALAEALSQAALKPARIDIGEISVKVKRLHGNYLAAAKTMN
jgi:hypothetical protein